MATRRHSRCAAYCRRGGYERLGETLALCTELYNPALQELRDAWGLGREQVGLNDQQRALTEIRGDLPRWGVLDVTVGRGVLRRIDRAFKSFFRHVKSGERAGYPHFKPRRR